MVHTCMNDYDDDSPKTKALWRREIAKRRSSCAWRNHAVKPRRTCVAPGKPDRDSKEPTGRAARSGGQKAAQRRIPLSEWFRSTLWEQANLAGTREGVQDEEDEEEDGDEDEEATDEEGEEGQEDVKMQADVELQLQHDEFAAKPCSSANLACVAHEFSGSQGTALPSRRLVADVAVQCEAEDMLEPMATSKMGQKCCLHHLKSAPLFPALYAAASHFSFFDDASCAVSRAAGLDETQLGVLAGQFLGPSIGGVKIEQKNCHNAWRVADRHVADATSLVKHVPDFRARLFTSARRLLLGGLPTEECRPLRGQSLLRLAHERPFMWAKLAYTALDFACRLMHEGALPTALALDILVLIRDQGWNEWVLGLLKLLSVIRRAPAHCRKRPSTVRRKSSRSILGVAQLAQQRPSTPQRTMSAPQQSVCSLDGSLSRAQTAPPTIFVHRGTSLRPQDVHQVNFAVSFSGASGRLVTHEVIPSEIKDCDLAEYWRNAAGGEHSEADLELMARQAEEEFQSQLEHRA
eukprot:TRINITY_DN107348_c0_g1_i1.p1 TRINITY_DN107348_c0_g1~~TRINITY_DN107348_c0_g1_i1.p1  ORF type:complete len:520 (-),score=82.10 TRINITY_DN107348_c0_g1_i1:236-1795(-)